jgi:chromosome segregation ATPase
VPRLPLPVRHRAPPTEERLLRLFWNRAELKREFAQLQRERDRLLEHLRQQEGAVLRLQQRHDQIEALLADPLRAASVVVYFQLRGAWQQGRRRLARLCQDLSARQREQERARDAARFRDNQSAALAAIEQRLAATADRQAALRDELAGLEGRRSALAAPWRYFERRNLEGEAAALRGAIESLDAQLERYARARQEKSAEYCEPSDMLSIDSRRQVNLAVLALAQELVLHFHDLDLAAQVREAALRGVVDVAYGDVSDCRRLGQRVARAVADLDRSDDWPARSQRRAAWLRRVVHYRQDSDVIPGPGALDLVPAAVPAGGDASPADGSAIAVNVLADDYWDLGSVLLD